MTDTERLDWLEKNFGIGLVDDDNGHWAVSDVGIQNVVTGDKPQFVQTTFLVDAGSWHNSIREAIDAAIKNDQEHRENQ